MERLLEKEKGIDSKRASEKGPLLDLLIHDLTGAPYRWSPRVQPVCLKRRVALAQGVRYAAKKYVTYIYKSFNPFWFLSYYQNLSRIFPRTSSINLPTGS
jgi:hypothetical protein